MPGHTGWVKDPRTCECLLFASKSPRAGVSRLFFSEFAWVVIKKLPWDLAPMPNTYFSYINIYFFFCFKLFISII